MSEIDERPVAEPAQVEWGGIGLDLALGVGAVGLIVVPVHLVVQMGEFRRAEQMLSAMQVSQLYTQHIFWMLVVGGLLLFVLAAWVAKSH